MYGVVGCRLARWSYRCGWLAASLILVTSIASAQVFVVGKEKPAGVPDFKPTAVQLSEKPLNEAGRQMLFGALAAEQGFAMRPLPLGTPGLVLKANGDLKFGSGDYYESLESKGVSAKIGERIEITNMKIEKNKIIFDFNGGPERKHKYLRHVSIGADPNYSTPVVRDDGIAPTGSRLTLEFEKFVPDMTADQIKELIEPVIDFRSKTPVQSYVEMLPPKLKAAILNHQALVGMDRKMVTYAMGQPVQKVREQIGNMPIEEWIYGETPHPIQFIRFNGNRVIRIETANFGQPLIVRSQDETDGYLNHQPGRTVAEGDAVVAANGENPSNKAPTLARPGEDLPQSTMQPVHKPTDPVAPSPIPAPPGQQYAGLAPE